MSTSKIELGTLLALIIAIVTGTKFVSNLETRVSVLEKPNHAFEELKHQVRDEVVGIKALFRETDVQFEPMAVQIPNEKHTAISDGIVTAYIRPGSGPNSLNGYIHDNGNDRSVVVNHGPVASITFPVAKGQTWSVKMLENEGGVVQWTAISRKQTSH